MKSNTIKKVQPKNIKSKKKSKQFSKENYCDRITRSKSTESEQVQVIVNDALKDSFSYNTRSNILLLKKEPPRETRSLPKKSEIIGTIDSNSKSKHKSRSKSESNITSTLKISPIKTRSKSAKFPIITCSSDHIQPPHSADREENRTRTCAITVKNPFIKINDFKVDSIVLAKQLYSFPWPAKVLKIEKDRIFVYFFGDKRCGYVSKANDMGK